jgi:hypothetical protein
MDSLMKPYWKVVETTEGIKYISKYSCVRANEQESHIAYTQALYIIRYVIIRAL